ncbi:hypothetical protein [Paraferrimonas sedimenticola]|uniref:Uncharacterized protein n=1 Tax=Paraferrimonas sedimenticola TaxID=375674 RepID=A0AA37VTB9_9GAMM|nr:hypothetical protein [Paraferrimonas sedimenticola]GLP95304.1 hypothetical protein GCM10007895_06100 [Paraferrimonas sedimenticola]
MQNQRTQQMVFEVRDNQVYNPDGCLIGSMVGTFTPFEKSTRLSVKELTALQASGYTADDLIELRKAEVI